MIAGYVPLSEEAKVFPAFRTGYSGLEPGTWTNWRLWSPDSVSEIIDPFPDALRTLPILEILSIEALRYRIGVNWRPKKRDF